MSQLDSKTIDAIAELFSDFDAEHPAFERIADFEERFSNELRIFILHKLTHWCPADMELGGEPIPPAHREYVHLMFGFLLGTEFARRGYEVTA